MILPSQRALFDIPEDVAYLNCAYMSPLMREVAAAGVRGIERKLRPWTIAARDFFAESDALRAAFARLVGAARPTDVAIVPAASYGVSVAARNLPLAAGESILVTEEQFPSNVYPWRERAREVDARIVTVGRPEDGDWTRAILRTVEATPRLAVVALPHCHWTDGGLVDLVAVGEACRRRGARLVVDATQSAGVVPLDVGRVRPDFLVAATYKWLLGPYSLGLLYVDEAWHEGTPLEHNWIHRANAENFARLVDYDDRFQPGALRYDVGERSNFVLVPMALAALERILDWGVARIAETIATMTARIEDGARALGLDAPPRSLRGPHYLCLRLADGLVDLPQRLAEEKIYVSVRGASLRVTPHLYNTEDDLDRLVDALRRRLGH